MVFLGEKDHGKSTLLGRLLHETDSIPRDRILGVRRAARKLGKKFEWAHLLDSFRYEREHEMTLDTTRALVNLGGKMYEFIDVPGHKELARNMITGASEASCAILLVDGIEGIVPQTKRHLLIAKFLGILHLIVVINKFDRIKNSQAEFVRIKSGVEALLSKSDFGKFVIIPISALKGENLIKKSDRFHWFRGPTLKRAILKEFVHSKEKNISDALRFAVQDFFPPDIVSGKAFSGKPAVGMRVMRAGSSKKYVIAKILSGNSLQLDPSPTHIKRGDILSDHPVLLKKNFSARCIFLKNPVSKNITVDAAFLQSPAKLKTGRVNLLDLIPAKLLFKKRRTLPDKFVLKTEGNIIAVCRNSSEVRFH